MGSVNNDSRPHATNGGCVIMEQLLIHLWGDYITQTDRMAVNKTKDIRYAFLHAFVYTTPFVMLTQSPLALAVMFITHAFIDRYRLARFVVYGFNRLHNTELKWVDCGTTGYRKEAPDWLTVWLLIIADNTIHMSINYLSIAYL